MNLEKLAEPFPADDIEWRVSRSGISRDGNIYAWLLAYITARAIQRRLDDACGPAMWKNEEPRVLTSNGKSAFVGGISIWLGTNWVTKWDVSEPTNVPNIDPAKGGFSGCMKRAGAQWGIGRYLYHLDETRAEISDENPRSNRWNYARLSEKHGHRVYYWKTPSLPSWALPSDGQEVSPDELNDLKKAWDSKFADSSSSVAEKRESFGRFVRSAAGDFPVDDLDCWTVESLKKCLSRIDETTDPGGVDSDVPFEGAS